MANKWNLIVDVALCDNCRLCFLAVKDEYVGNDFPGQVINAPLSEATIVGAAIGQALTGKQPVACLKQISDRWEDQKSGSDLLQLWVVTLPYLFYFLALVFLTNAYLQVRAVV